jgi:hypothetical protein
MIAKHYNYINNEFEFELENLVILFPVEKINIRCSSAPLCVFPFEFLLQV